MFNNPSVVLSHLDVGKLRALGITSDKRIAQVSSVPTFVEAGYPQLTATEWIGLLAPAGTPRPIIEKLNSAVNNSLKAPEVREAFQRLGLESRAVSPQEFKTFMTEETAKWAQVIAQTGIKGE
jgi:tripartite-type tricarboxylate transporter receptor subunit TctC